MRKIIFSILLASAAASPALARPDDPNPPTDQQAQKQEAQEQRQARREERQQVREQRVNPGNGEAARVQQQQVFQQQQQQQQVFQQQQRQQFEQRRRGFGDGGDYAARQRAVEQQQQTAQQQQVIQQQQRQAFDRRGEFDRRQREQTQQWQGRGGSNAQQQWQGRGGTDAQQQWQRRQYDGQRSWSQQSGQWNQGSRYAGNWNRDWRNDRRYDWRRYRNSHRSVFQLGIYYDPFGYGYQPFNIGYRLPYAYFGQQYWIDPAMYQLPYPPPGTTWIRYWDDALLVDMYTGQVVDVIHNFFW